MSGKAAEYLAAVLSVNIVPVLLSPCTKQTFTILDRLLCHIQPGHCVMECEHVFNVMHVQRRKREKWKSLHVEVCVLWNASFAAVIRCSSVSIAIHPSLRTSQWPCHAFIWLLASNVLLDQRINKSDNWVWLRNYNLSSNQKSMRTTILQFVEDG